MYEDGNIDEFEEKFVIICTDFDEHFYRPEPKQQVVSGVDEPNYSSFCWERSETPTYEQENVEECDQSVFDIRFISLD